MRTYKEIVKNYILIYINFSDVIDFTDNLFDDKE